MAIDLKFLSDLTQDDLDVLKGLSSIGAATPTDLAVRLGRMTEDLAPRLQALHSKGLVMVIERESGLEREIYRVSPSGLSLVGP